MPPHDDFFISRDMYLAPAVPLNEVPPPAVAEYALHSGAKVAAWTSVPYAWEPVTAAGLEAEISCSGAHRKDDLPSPKRSRKGNSKPDFYFQVLVRCPRVETCCGRTYTKVGNSKVLKPNIVIMTGLDDNRIHVGGEIWHESPVCALENAILLRNDLARGRHGDRDDDHGDVQEAGGVIRVLTEDGVRLVDIGASERSSLGGSRLHLDPKDDQ